jgi:calcineurin-like phosphoesterase family protein
VLEKCTQVLGHDHPDTLQAMDSLAVTYHNIGELHKAQELDVVVLEKQQQVLGDDHPDTLWTMGNLASTYHDLGELHRAEELKVVVLEKRKKFLGDDHPDTLRAMENLALTYHCLGDFHRAQELEVVVLEKRKKVLGDHHPDTLRAMGNLLSREMEGEAHGLLPINMEEEVECEAQDKKCLSQEAEVEAQDMLPIDKEVVAWSPKKKENSVTMVLPPDQLQGAALLLLPTYFLTQNIVTNTIQSHLLWNIARFTVSRSLEVAASDSEYECVQKQVREEWRTVGHLVRDLSILRFFYLTNTYLAFGSRRVSCAEFHFCSDIMRA